MFERKKYKSFAKQQLKGRWTVPVLITLVSSFIMFLFDIPDTIRLFNNPDFWDLIYYDGSDLLLFSTKLTEVSDASSSLLSTLLKIVAQAILTVAAINTWLKMSRSPEKVSFKSFIEGFNDWGRAALGALWQYLWVMIWTMLFIIPGIVKSFAYSQMFFILSEYENVSVTKSMKISMIITHGHKGDLFVTYLSFLGWAILCTLSLGIGFLWLEPYMNMTLTNAYHAMLKEAIETGKIKPEDLTE